MAPETGAIGISDTRKSAGNTDAGLRINARSGSAFARMAYSCFYYSNIRVRMSMALALFYGRKPYYFSRPG